MKLYTVAVLGATGAVGQEMIKILQERNFPVGKLIPLASKRSAGKTLTFKGEEVTIQEACDEAFAGVEANDLRFRFKVVLEDNSLMEKTDQEIKNMSAVFKVLAEEILPELRRTRFAVEATYAGLTDEEILAAAKAGCTKLDIEHLLHAATLTDNVAEKSAIYELAANTYGDARAYNNLGVCKVLSGDLKGAKAAFEKAEAQPEVAGNLAAVALAMGDLESAKKYLSSADAEAVKATQGALALAEGNYQEAKANLNGYNLAIAELCDNNVEGAKKAIAEVKGADADYVRAIIANREGDADKAAAYLKSAVAAKPELKAQAQNDIEFYELLQTIEL